MLLETIKTKTTFCRYCRQPLTPEVNRPYHQNCHYVMKNYKYDIWDIFGLKRNKFLPKEQLKFVKDLEHYVSDFNPKLLHKKRLPIIDYLKPNYIAKYYEKNEHQIIALTRNFSVLNYMYLIQIPIERLPNSISKVSTLERIGIQDCELKTIQPELCSLKNLKELFIHNCPITSIPSDIGNLTNLETLKITNTNIRSLPESIGNLSNLHELDLHSNKLQSLPNSLQKLTQLTELNLRDNNFKSLPLFFPQLPSLTTYGWSLDMYG